MKMQVVHLTSVHPRYDSRIFHKECKSLSKKYNVNLIVADGKGDEVKENIRIFDVGNAINRFDRVFRKTNEIFKKAIEIDAEIYHLHDPELIPIGLKLKKLGKRVIFDSHEDIPKQILAKHYLYPPIRNILSFGYSKYEIFALKKLDFTIGATPFVRDKFLKSGIKSLDINNFPVLNEFIGIEPAFEEKNICYIGALYPTRGIKEIVKAVENIDVKLIVAGNFFDKSFEKEIKSLRGWKNVDYRGFVDRNEVRNILKNSIAGLVTLHPTPSYMEAYPVKMFEYMSAGISVIASDFPLYKGFVENKCGICVNPLNIKEIEKAIKILIENRSLAKEFGKKGKELVKARYNWKNEEKKLFELYEKVLNG